MTYPLVVSEYAGVRYLHFGSEWVQGAMRVSRPRDLEIEYTRHLMAALAIFPKPQTINRTLQIGLGAASVTKFLVDHLPTAQHTVLEIDPRVPAYAQAYFALTPAPGLKVIHADANVWLPKSRERYDLIVIDGFDQNAECGTLNEMEFLRIAQAHLTVDGLVAVNLFGHKHRYTRAFASLKRVFGSDSLATMPACRSGNVVVFAGTPIRQVKRKDLLDQARALRQGTGLAVVTALGQLRLPG
jgi:spermidine synthase